MAKYEPAKSGDRFDTSKFLGETVRLADRTTRDLMFAAHAGKASPKALAEIAEAYRHAANRVTQVADWLAMKAREAKEQDNVA